MKVPSDKFFNSSTTCILPVGVPNRYSPCITLDTHVPIQYHPDDIHIVGGAAFHLYAGALDTIRRETHVRPQEDIVGRLTEDIDLIWWPRINFKGAIIPINTPEMGRFTHAVKDMTASLFEKESNISVFKGVIEDIILKRPLSSFSTSVTLADTIAAGVYTISVIFTIDGKPLKICELAIHDSGSSQRVKMDGTRIDKVISRIQDPVYSAPASLQVIRIQSLQTRVPSLKDYITQQAFGALNLLERTGEESRRKATVLWSRIYFLSLILREAESDEREEVNGIDLRWAFDAYHRGRSRLKERHAGVIAELCRAISAKDMKLAMAALCALGSGETRPEVLQSESNYSMRNRRGGSRGRTRRRRRISRGSRGSK